MTPMLMGTYPEPAVTFVRGEGALLWSDTGDRYVDLIAGLAVCSAGHAHPDIAAALAEQAGALWHVSNLFGTEPARRLADQLDRLIGGGGAVFFANSGAESNECAFKLARKAAGPGRHKIVSLYESFHGRTLAALAATGQPAKHEPFAPMPEGFAHVVAEDVAALDAAVDGTVAAVIVEVVQGEGGVRPLSAAYLSAVREICDAAGALVIVDEVQTGLGRTGAWFAHHHHPVLRPDIVTVAKALGNGMPIGACWARRAVADAFDVGDHATTYGGQPLATAAAAATLDVLERIDAPGAARRIGEAVTARLSGSPGVVEVRGLGALLAVEIDGPPGVGPTVARSLLDAGVVVGPCTATSIRLAPPLVIEGDLLADALDRIAEAVATAATDRTTEVNA